ncbi:MAG: dipeptidase [Clostridia bacterium]
MNSIELHRDALVVDGHVDTLMAAVKGQRKLGERSHEGHADFPRLREGGVNVQLFAHYIEPDFKPDRGLLRFMQMADAFFREVEENGDIATHVKTVSDIERLRAEGKLGCVMSIEGAEAIAGDLGVLRVLFRLGVRVIGLTWNQRNLLADGIGEARTGGGLTELGVAAVREMDRLGVVVDVSHLSDPGFWDVVEVSRRPFVASHSNSRAVCDHPRNLTDDQIKALARAGGVMGMNFAPNFVHPDLGAKADPVSGSRAAPNAPRATLEMVLDHIDHIVELVGPEHVGLGSDFDGIGDTPDGLEDPTKLPDLTAGLLRRGYPEDDVRAILGGNFLRVFREVWPSD